MIAQLDWLVRLTWDLHQRIKISATILKSSVESASGSFSHLDLEWTTTWSRDINLRHISCGNGAQSIRNIGGLSSPNTPSFWYCTCCCPHSGWAWGRRRTGLCRAQRTHPGWAARPPGCHLCCRPLGAPLQIQPTFAAHQQLISSNPFISINVLTRNPSNSLVITSCQRYFYSQ